MNVPFELTDSRAPRPKAPIPDRIPSSAAGLGALGAVPFVAFAVAGLLLEDAARGHASDALGTYGAVILSFLGGVHWGLAIVRFGARMGRERIAGRLVLSVAPSLVAWMALFLPQPASLLTLAAAFLVMLFVDWRLSGEGYIPT